MAFITWIASASWASSKKINDKFTRVYAELKGVLRSLLLVFNTLRLFLQMLCKWTEALISVLDKGQLRMEICWRLKRWTSVDHVPGTMSKKLIMFNYIMNLTEISRSQFVSAKKITTTMGVCF